MIIWKSNIGVERTPSSVSMEEGLIGSRESRGERYLTYILAQQLDTDDCDVISSEEPDRGEILRTWESRKSFFNQMKLGVVLDC